MIPASLTSPNTPTFFLETSQIEAGVAASRSSARGRLMQILQRDSQCQVQRLLNFMQPGSYVQPHCHPEPHAIETVTPLQGAIHVWIFDATGEVQCCRTLLAGSPTSCLLDMEPGVWHTFAAAEPDTVVLEIKRGPYDAATDKQFADWAPAESAVGAAEYLQRLMLVV